MSSSGDRITCVMLRPVMVHPSVTAQRSRASEVWAGGGPAGRPVGSGVHVVVMRLSSFRSVLRAYAARRRRLTSGQVQECLVERGPAQPDVLDRDPRVDQGPHHVGEGGDPIGHRGAEPTGLGVAVRGRGADPPDDLGGEVQFGRVVHHDLDPIAADLRLQLVRGALGDHPSGVDHRDPVGQLVRLFEVLGGEQHGGAVPDEGAYGVPELVAAARVEAGGRLVQEEHLRRHDQAGGEVEPAAHAAGVLARRLAGRVGEPELLQQLVRPSPGDAWAEVVEPAEQGQVLSPAEQSRRPRRTAR